MPELPSDNAALIEFAKAHLGAKVENVAGYPFLVLPSGMKVESAKRFIDEYRERPERRAGTASLTDLPSFIEHAKRFADKHSALFALMKPAPSNPQALESPRLVSMLDYHEQGPEGLARFGQHRGLYVCPFSEEWRAWVTHNGSKMNQQEFAEFIEDRIGDIMATPDAPEGGDQQLAEVAGVMGGQYCSAAQLMELSRGIQVHTAEKIRQAVTLATGEIDIVYQTEHGEAGARLRTRNLFVLAIPVFEAGAFYRLIGRLRFRANQGQIQWHYMLWRAERVLRHAFDEVCAKAVEHTGLPLYRGQPEA